MKLDDCQLFGFDNDYNMTVLAQLNMLLMVMEMLS